MSETWLTFSDHRIEDKLGGELYDILGHVDFSDQCFDDMNAGSEEYFSMEALQRIFHTTDLGLL